MELHRFFAAVIPWQLLIEVYTLSLSYRSISNLRVYEDKAQKAAKYSNVAQHQLHKTQVTEASGVGAIVLSLLTTLLIFYFTIVQSQQSTTTSIFLSTLNIATCLFARSHMSNFWHGKAKIPLVNAYNEAITRSNQICRMLGYLAGTWGFMGGVVGLLAMFVGG